MTDREFVVRLVDALQLVLDGVGGYESESGDTSRYWQYGVLEDAVTTLKESQEFLQGGE